MGHQIEYLAAKVHSVNFIAELYIKLYGFCESLILSVSILLIFYANINFRHGAITYVFLYDLSLNQYIWKHRKYPNDVHNY